MSHLAERKEKNCLNCGAEVQGRYCHICGQENIEPKESFWHLVTHFLYDITHFDGKFFSTLKYLLFRPGFLSHEYLRGRRASYLHPIRMYVFTSAFFFLIFFSAHKEEDAVKIDVKKETAAQVLKKLEKRKKGLSEDLQDSMPDLAKNAIRKGIEAVNRDIEAVKKDSTAKDRLESESSNFAVFGGNDKTVSYETVAQYDSAQKKMPEGKRPGFILGKIERQNIYLKEKYHNDQKAIWTAILNKFRHLVPQMLFVSLPFFALILQLLYVRRKSIYYVNHVVYTIHLYCATFIIILLGMGIEYLAGFAGKDAAGWTGLFFTLAGLFYWYKALRNFYGQGRGKTILKYCIALFLALILMTLIFILFFIFSAMAI